MTEVRKEPASKQEQKLSIILSKGSLDMAYPAFMLADKTEIHQQVFNRAAGFPPALRLPRTDEVIGKRPGEGFFRKIIGACILNE